MFLHTGRAHAADPGPGAPATITVTSDPRSGSDNGTQFWHSGPNRIFASAFSNGVSIDALDSTARYDQASLSFAPPDGSPLAVGTYNIPPTGTDHPDRYLMLGAGFHGCQVTSGRFQVVDLAADLSRFWILFEAHCDYLGPAYFGEVRYNEPTDSDATLSYSHVVWPKNDIGGTGATVPIQVFNPAPTPLGVTNVAVTGPAAADFPLDPTPTACTSIPSGTGCFITVHFVPTASGDREATLTISDTSAAGTHSVALSGQVGPPSTASVTADAGEYLTGGTPKAWRSGPDIFDVSRQSMGSLDLQLNRQGADPWDFGFSAAPGQSLVPGTYHLDPDSTSGAHLAISGHQRACSPTEGQFTVHDLSDDTSKFWITYVVHCDGRPAAFGELRYNEPAGSDVVAIPTRVDWPDAFTHEKAGSASVTLVNLGATTATNLGAALSGATANDYALDNPSACLSIAPGRTCTLTVGFTPGNVGDRPATLSFTAGAGLPDITLDGQGRQPVSTVTLDSQTYSDYTAGTAQLWRDGLDRITLKHVAPGHIEFDTYRGADSNFADAVLPFIAAPGTTLAPGRYLTTGGKTTIIPLDQIRDDAACEPGSSWLDILDLPADLSRAWILFGRTCDGTGPTGEIRYNEPADPDVVVAPTHLAYARRYATESGPPIPVTVINTGQAPLTVTGATFSGAAAADYTVTGLEACVAIPVDGSCALQVSLVAAHAGTRDADLHLTDTSAAGGRTVHIVASAIPIADKPDNSFPGSLQGTENGSTIHLSWRNPAAPAWTHTVIRGAQGSLPPADENSGFSVYTGRDTTATYTNAPPNQQYSFAAFAEFSDGSITTTYAAVNAVILTLAVDHPRAVYGSTFTFIGTFRDTDRNQSSGNLPITLVGKDSTGKTVITTAPARTDSVGAFTFHVQPDRTLSYQAVYASGGPPAGASNVVPVNVIGAFSVAKAAHAGVKHGKSDAITFMAFPQTKGVAAQLQLYKSGKWVKVTTVSTDKYGRGTFTVKPTKKGSYKYRIYWPTNSNSDAAYSKTITIKAT